MTTASINFPRVIPRPKSHSGIWSWIGTVDHKRIGTMYGITAFFWFIVGGLEALLIRTQLSRAESDLVSPELFNQLFTMHGTTMIFLVVMPMASAFFNWLVPLQIGARDVAFPRLNAFSYWVFLFGGILINTSWLFGLAPDGGWFGYAPLSQAEFSAGMTFWSVGLNVLGIASIAAALNFVVTILNMRAPGLTMFKLPVFTWNTLITSVLILVAMPVIAVALTQVMFDRLFGTNFYVPAAGGDPVLWQHMFWLFGHPEVYILIVPAFGIVSEVLPTFSRKPLFGYPFVIFATIAIAFQGWFVWSHHMFTVGLGPVVNSFFGISTMAIAVPTGVKIFNWLGTMWGGSLRLNTAMLFSIGFIAMFTIGGFSGVMHAVVPHNAQQQDTYFVVAHFHYVLFGGAVMAIFSGIYYWWPKMTGWLLNEKLGITNFILMMIGFNLTFFPMHWVGLDGMPRRIYTFAAEMGWETSNMAITIGSFILALGVLVFMINVVVSRRNKAVAGNDPWDARTIEWTIPSPPPPYNFAEIPVVEHRDDFWYKKYPHLHEEHLEALDHESNITEGREYDPERHEATVSKEDAPLHGGGSHGIHLPDMSYYPIILAAGIAIAMGGLMFSYIVSVLGAVLIVWGLLGWSLEPASEPDH
ncbi:MAG: cytochrome c oxidase subunit I [Dehalococcoidia bacterium]